MSAIDVTWGRRSRSVGDTGLERARAVWSRRREVPMPSTSTSARRLAMTLALIVVAYHYSLLTLVRTLKVETPLAYLGLVPFISLLLASARQRNAGYEPPIHDRQVDYIIGVPLLAAALSINIFLPVGLSTMFWVYRIDLLSFPLFVAGAVAIVFGVRTLWRVRTAVAFLVLAWPLPYTALLLRGLQGFTSITLAGIRGALRFMPVAKAAPGSDGSLFSVVHGGRPFLVSVASACSGVNGMVGFLLIAVAFMSVVLGPRVLKVLWLTGGLALLWVLNVGRILLIFAVGAQWGEHVTIKGLHPYIGLVVFNLGVGVMLLAMRPFGLHLVTAPPKATSPHAGVRSDQADPARDPRATKPAVPKARTALIVVGVIGLLVGLTNEGLKSYDLVSTDLGTPRLASFTATALAPAGWAAHKTDTFDWAKQFFGETSTWIRYSYNWDGKPSDALRANVPITTDVIQTSDLSTFSTYGIEACYRFHGYKLKDVRSVDLGGGVTGNVVAYYNSAAKSDWTSVYWYWPVKTSSGTRYERIVVMMTDSAKADVEAPAPSPSVARSIGLKLQNALSGFHAGTLDAKLLQTRAFLVAFAQSLVSAERSTPATTSR